MKYIDRVIDTNADGENFEKGVRLELDYLELQTIYKTIENAIDTDDNDLYTEQKELLEKLEIVYEISYNGYLTQIEIE